MATYLVTGGAGFIGSNFIHYLLWTYPDAQVINVDALEHAGNLANVADLADDQRHLFVHADICDERAMDELFAKHGPDYVVNFAAQTHVDRGIEDPMAFNRSNVAGALTLLQLARKDWEEPGGGYGGHRFLQVSTDEVYGSLPGPGAPLWREDALLAPRNPYSASKASAELYTMAYADTYGLPVIITRSSNTYGPFQFPEKLIPLVITRALAHRDIPLYGDGLNLRDWVYIADLCQALDLVLHRGRVRQVYNIGARNQCTNVQLVGELVGELARQTGDAAIDETLVSYVADRKGHDRAYGVDPSKLERELGWHPHTTLRAGLAKTVAWYLANPQWVGDALTARYQHENQRLLSEWRQA
ncbi:MAG: dTDP-glucose 4,6-dehydratase [Coriobacteriales bacterium]